MNLGARSVRFGVLVVLVLAAAAVSGQQKMEPVPANLKVAEQPESPVRIGLTGVRGFGGRGMYLGYTVSNVGSKTVWGVLLKGLEQPDKRPVMMVGAAIQPNGKQELGIGIGTAGEAGERVIAVDMVVFSDGTHWGAGSLEDSEVLRGIFEGQRAAVSDMKPLLQRNDEAAIRHHLTREPYLPEAYRIENRTKRQEGFVRGYGAGIINLRRDLLGRGDVKGIPFRITEMEENLGLAPPAKDGRRQISREYWFNEPVKIEAIYSGGKRVEVDERFEADQDWLKGLRIRIRNNSGKTMTHISLGLDLPETIATGSMMRFPLSYGENPMAKSLPARPAGTFAPVTADGSVELALDEKGYDDLVRFVEQRQPLAGLTRVRITISMIHFDDGTAWNGMWLRQDPNNPRAWISVEK